MAELRTEEEQLDVIKRWWKENGTALIAGVAIAVAGLVGWNFWQNHQASQSEAASVRYERLINLTDQGNIDEARSLVVEIADNHAGTLYADLALLIDARLAVDAGELRDARQALEDLIASSDHNYLQGLARLRLARVQLAEGDAQAALDTLAQNIPEALAAQHADIRGDALHVLERRDEARQAWQEALAIAEQHDQPIYGVQLKLDDLGLEETPL